MNDLRKSLSKCLLATAALLVGASPAWAQVSLGAASDFSVLGFGAVTCTDAVVTGDVGVSPGTAFTNTRCTFADGTPPATDDAADEARADFNIAYAALAPSAGECDTAHTLPSTMDSRTLAPGTYCTGAALTATGQTLTLDGGGNSNAVWIFKIGAALTGTNFSVVMANGGQPCNVYWRVGAAVSMTDSLFKGTILAGAAITTTRGTVAGRALAGADVTITGTGFVGCDTLSEVPSCKQEKHHRHHKHHKHHKGQGNGHDWDDDDNGKGKGHGSRDNNPFKR